MRVLMSQPASSSPYHNGGRILFGPDGMLYAIVGDGHDSTNSQDLSGNLRGKILRMTPDRRPCRRTTRSPGSRIFAFGIRNSFGFTFDPQTDSLWETENGPECNDEINLIVGGGNFGWGPSETCGGTLAGEHEQQRSDAAASSRSSGSSGRSASPAMRSATAAAWGAEVEGQLFFGDVNTGVLRRVALNAARDDVSGGAIDVLDTPGGAIYSMETAPNGQIYFSDAQAIYRLAPA